METCAYAGTGNVLKVKFSFFCSLLLLHNLFNFFYNCEVHCNEPHLAHSSSPALFYSTFIFYLNLPLLVINKKTTNRSSRCCVGAQIISPKTPSTRLWPCWASPSPISVCMFANLFLSPCDCWCVYCSLRRVICCSSN